MRSFLSRFVAAAALAAALSGCCDCTSGRIAPERMGVCSWSWRADLKTVAARMDAAGVKGVHLALGPFIAPDGRHGAAESKETWDYVKAKVASG